jgi:hypothetical protein
MARKQHCVWFVTVAFVLEKPFQNTATDELGAWIKTGKISRLIILDAKPADGRLLVLNLQFLLWLARTKPSNAVAETPM